MRHPEARFAGLELFWGLGLFQLYLDEFGHPGVWDPADPRHRHHPLFGLAGLAVNDNRWRDLDRGFLRLKRKFYKNEIERASILKGIRPERYEPKQLRSRRDKRFAFAALELVRGCGGTVFANGVVKNSTLSTHDEVALYNSTTQGALRQFERFLRNAAGRATGRGVVIMDRRDEAQNQRVLHSAQSYLFSDPAFRGRDPRIVETPLLVPSEWYHGVQLADSIGRVVGAVYRHRCLGDARYRRDDDEFGPMLDGLSAQFGRHTTLFIR